MKADAKLGPKKAKQRRSQMSKLWKRAAKQQARTKFPYSIAVLFVSITLEVLSFGIAKSVERFLKTYAPVSKREQS